MESDGGVAGAGEFLHAGLSRDDVIEADLIKELAHLLFRIAENKKWTKDALSFNTLVTIWPEIVDAAQVTATTRASSQTALAFDEE